MISYSFSKKDRCSIRKESLNPSALGTNSEAIFRTLFFAMLLSAAVLMDPKNILKSNSFMIRQTLFFNNSYKLVWFYK